MSWGNDVTSQGQIPSFTAGSRDLTTVTGVTTAGSDLSALLPGYTLERELGRGAMGVVYLARHESLGRLVAVKELQGTLASDPATRSRFVVEAKVMAAMDHPHVVPVYDFVERDDRCALVMEQLPGGTVWDRFVTDGISMPHATAITLATCSAMQHAHDGGVLHRDIKPENLMFDGAGAMKVTDFGIARVVNGASTKATVAGTVLGTPAYMAPEQAEGKDVAAPVDVYATATMLYEMLSGRLPFDRTDSLTGMLTQRILHDPTPLSQTAPHVPAELADATMRGLVRDPAQRTSTARQFGHELANAAAVAWGASWLDASGIVVSGSDSIERAARRTGRSSTPVSDPRSTMLPGATPPADADRASETLRPASADAPPLPTETVGETAPEDSTRHAPTETSDATEPPVAGAVEPPASTAPARKIKPTASDRDVGRAKADEVDQLIDISEILKAPPRPVAQYLIAAALFVAALAWAVFGGGGGSELTTFSPDAPENGLRFDGQPLTEQPIDLDLSEPIVVDGLVPPGGPGAPIEIEFEQLGAPIGSASSTIDGSTLTFDPGFIGRITSGAVDATILQESEDGPPLPLASFTATGTNPWYLTAAGIISVIVVLFGAAGIESSLRAFRRGRGKITTFVGLLITGALLGASAAIASTIIFGTSRELAGVVGPAALSAGGALALGLATRASRKRRRAARQELRHTAIKALVRQ